jgi:hypothetical protein
MEEWEEEKYSLIAPATRSLIQSFKIEQKRGFTKIYNSRLR